MLRFRRAAARFVLMAAATLAAGGCLSVDPIPFVDIVVEARTPAGAPIPDLRAEAVGGLSWSTARSVEFTGADGTARLRVPGGVRYELRVYAPDATWSPAVAVDTVQADQNPRPVRVEFAPPE